MRVSPQDHLRNIFLCLSHKEIKFSVYAYQGNPVLTARETLCVTYLHPP